MIIPRKPENGASGPWAPARWLCRKGCQPPLENQGRDRIVSIASGGEKNRLCGFNRRLASQMVLLLYFEDDAAVVAGAAARFGRAIEIAHRVREQAAKRISAIASAHEEIKHGLLALR